MADAPKKKVPTEEEKAARFEAAKKMTSELVDKSEVALKEFSTYTQEQVDKIVAAMALAGSENSLLLAHEAHDDTGRGVVEDKDTKNRFASESVYNAIKNDKTVGVISEDRVTGKVELAAPLGILAGIVPTTQLQRLFSSQCWLLRRVTRLSSPSTHKLKSHQHTLLRSFTMQPLPLVLLRTSSNGLRSHH